VALRKTKSGRHQTGPDAEPGSANVWGQLEPSRPLGVLKFVLETESDANEGWNYPFVRKSA